MNPKRRLSHYVLVTLTAVFAFLFSSGYVFWFARWQDSDSIVFEVLFAGSFNSEAQGEMAESNRVDTLDASHPLRVDGTPGTTFGAEDSENTMGFLSEAEVLSEYGTDYTEALAWTFAWTSVSTGFLVETDIVFDPTLAWSLTADPNTWFQSTMLHELGHVRGLDHQSTFQSMMNVTTSKHLRDETLYADDQRGLRVHNSHVEARDAKFYNKWHDNTVPRWMTMSSTTVKEGDTLELQNITIENLGSQSFDDVLRFGIYLSSNNFISTADQLVETGFFTSLTARSTFNRNIDIPPQADCTTRYIGGLVDYLDEWDERIESNNAVVFTDGDPYVGNTYQPAPIQINLADDAYEPNELFADASSIGLPFSDSTLRIEADLTRDYYEFTIAEPSTVAIEIDFAHSLGDLSLHLLNSSGIIVASSGSSTDDEAIDIELNAGSYKALVTGPSGGQCNKYGMTVVATELQPDLEVSGLNPSHTTVAPGGLTIANHTVLNQGAAASASGRVGIYLSDNDNCTTFDQLLGQRNLAALDPGQDSSHNLLVTVPADVEEGPYWLCAIADDLEAIPESNEANNTRSVPFVVGVPPQPPLFGDGFETGDLSGWSSSS